MVPLNTGPGHDKFFTIYSIPPQINSYLFHIGQWGAHAALAPTLHGNQGQTGPAASTLPVAFTSQTPELPLCFLLSLATELKAKNCSYSPSLHLPEYSILSELHWLLILFSSTYLLKWAINSSCDLKKKSMKQLDSQASPNAVHQIKLPKPTNTSINFIVIFLNSKYFKSSLI